MKEERDYFIPGFLSGLALGLAAALVAFIGTKDSWQRDSVRRGCAEWAANKYGDAEWQWTCGSEPEGK